jgi:hypothetical protein
MSTGARIEFELPGTNVPSIVKQCRRRYRPGMRRAKKLVNRAGFD